MHLACGIADLKTCSKCAAEKPLSEFFKYSGRDGYRPACKACLRAQREASVTPERVAREKARRAEHLARNSERVSAALATYRANNKAICAVRVAAWRALNANRYSTYGKEWRERNRGRRLNLARAHRANNPDAYRHYRAKRRAAELKATPAWADLGRIRGIYRDAADLGMHVDHIVPLMSPIVCGLHCEANLMPLPSSDNLQKGNRYWPDMP